MMHKKDMAECCC